MVEDTNPPWTARERAVITQMRCVEKSEQIQVDISEMEHLLLGAEDADIGTTSLAENARDEGRSQQTRAARHDSR